jgi:hypothetical protein
VEGTASRRASAAAGPTALASASWGVQQST